MSLSVLMLIYGNEKLRYLWDSLKHSGTQKLLDISRITALGFSSGIELATGIKLAYKVFADSF